MTTSDLDSSASGAKFRKSQRLLSPDEFSQVFKGRARGQVKGFTFFSKSHQSEATGARLGLSVSKKVSSRATHRNRIKRIIRESFRHNCGNLPAKDIVIVAQARSVDMTNKELYLSLQNIWSALAQE